MNLPLLLTSSKFSFLLDVKIHTEDDIVEANSLILMAASPALFMFLSRCEKEGEIFHLRNGVFSEYPSWAVKIILASIYGTSSDGEKFDISFTPVSLFPHKFSQVFLLAQSLFLPMPAWLSLHVTEDIIVKAEIARREIEYYAFFADKKENLLSAHYRQEDDKWEKLSYRLNKQGLDIIKNQFSLCFIESLEIRLARNQELYYNGIPVGTFVDLDYFINEEHFLRAKNVTPVYLSTSIFGLCSSWMERQCKKIHEENKE